MSGLPAALTWAALRSAGAKHRTVRLRDGRYGEMNFADDTTGKVFVIIDGQRECIDVDDIVSLVAPKETQCVGKRAHTKGDAKRARDQMQSLVGRRMNVYRCPHCDYWHVGSSTKDPS